MPTISDMWEKKNTYTKNSSEIARTLALSGLAVVWIFREPSASGSALPPILIWASAAILLALILDLLQYVVGALTTGSVAKNVEATLKREKKPETTEVEYPKNHPVPMNVLWGIKIVVVLAAWGILLFHIVHKALAASLPAVSD